MKAKPKKPTRAEVRRLERDTIRYAVAWAAHMMVFGAYSWEMDLKRTVDRLREARAAK